MAQSAGTPEFLDGKDYTLHLLSWGRHGFVWMNLQKYGSKEIKTVPVRIVKKLSKDFKDNYFKKRNSS